MSSKIRIRIRGLTKTYHLYPRPADRLRQMVANRLGRGRCFYQEFHALHGIDLDVADGEVLGIVGRNGAGKSTLLQILCGTLTPTSGTVEVHGRVAALLELGAGFNPEFTGRENIRLNAAVLGLSPQEIEARLEDIIAFADIGPFVDQPVKTYSSGMFVRLAFAVASSVEPDILIIDEALSVGDGAFARKSFDRILELKARGTTILFCSHALYQVEAFCSRAVWLEAGRIRMLGAPAEVVAAYNQSLAAGAQPTTPAALPAPPQGTGRITAVETRLDGRPGTVLRGRSGASTLSVTVAFQMDPDLPPPSVGVVLDYGSVVAAASAILQGVPRDAAGRGVACATFPDLALRKGEYRISVYLACEQAVHLYDQAITVATLTLDDPSPAPGLVHLPHTWTTGHVLVHGRPFHVDPADSLGLAAAGGVFEPRETALLCRLARPGMRALDVGANMGYHTLLLAQAAGPSGLVVAVEPDPANIALLRHNLAPELAQGRVRLIPAALGEAPGRLPLFQAENAGMHRLYPSVCCTPTFHEVEVLPGDRLDLAPLDIIKVDVEGFEPAVLRGLRATIAASPDVAILTEFSPLAMLEAGFDPAELIDVLSSHDLVPHTLDDDGTPQPLDPAALRQDTARIPKDQFPAWRNQLQGHSAATQAQAAQDFLLACGYPRPLYETLLWRRQ